MRPDGFEAERAVKSCSFSTSLRRWLAGWIPLGIYSAVVVQGALLSPEDFPRFFSRWDDKFAHGAEYFFLFLFALNAFEKAKSVWLRNFSRPLGFGYCSLMGGLTECAQFFVPGRSPELKDFAADLLGAGAGALCAFFWKLADKALHPKGSSGLL